MADTEQIKRRNKLIATIQAVFNVGYAHACHIYYCLHNIKRIERENQ